MRYLLVVIGALFAVATTSQARIIRLQSVTVASVVVGTELSTSVSLTVTDQLAMGNTIQNAEIASQGSTPVFRVQQGSFRDTISIGQPFTIGIAFSPDVLGRHNANLLIAVGSKQEGDTILVALTGIGLPLRVVPKELDFGIVERGRTLEKSFSIFNDGSAAVAVQLGKVAAPFRLLNGQTGQGITIAAQDFAKITVECAATELGIHTSSVMLTTASGNTVGISDTVELAVTVSEQSRKETVQFGSVVIGTSREMSYVLRNPFNEQVQVTVGNIEGGNAFEFIPSYRDKIAVPANGSAVISLRFTPLDKGIAVPAQFSISSTIPDFTSVVVSLQGRGIDLEGIGVQADIVHANVGDMVSLPIFATIPTHVKSDFLLSNVDSMQCSFEMVVNASMAYIAEALPVDRVYIETGGLVAHVQAMVHFSKDDTTKSRWLVASIPLRVLLGDAASTPIKLRNVEWNYNGSAIARRAEVPEGEGKLVIDNIFTWPNGEKRLIATRRGPLELTIVPNPMNENTTIDASGFTGRAIVSIYTPLGEQVFAKTIEKPSSFTFSRSEIQGIAPGLYYCRLSAGRYSLVKLLRVE